MSKDTNINNTEKSYFKEGVILTIILFLVITVGTLAYVLIKTKT